MFIGPSLHWSALNHWFLPSLSPISILSTTAEPLRCFIVNKETKQNAKYVLSLINLRLNFLYFLWCRTSLFKFMINLWLCKLNRASLLFTKPQNHQGSSVHASGLAATAMLRLAACHQQRIIGPEGFRVGWCVWMVQPYPIISNGARCYRKGEWGTPIITTSYFTTHLFALSLGLLPLRSIHRCCA